MDSICPSIWVGSMGEVGSWVLSCATSSCRNKSLELLASVSEVELVLLVELVEPVCAVVARSARASAEVPMGLIIVIFSFTLFPDCDLYPLDSNVQPARRVEPFRHRREDQFCG